MIVAIRYQGRTIGFLTGMMGEPGLAGCLENAKEFESYAEYRRFRKPIVRPYTYSPMSHPGNVNPTKFRNGLTRRVLIKSRIHLAIDLLEDGFQDEMIPLDAYLARLDMLVARLDRVS